MTKVYNSEEVEKIKGLDKENEKKTDIEEINGRDEQFGFVHYAAGPTKTGWILNMKSVTTNIKKEICN